MEDNSKKEKCASCYRKSGDEGEKVTSSRTIRIKVANSLIRYRRRDGTVVWALAKNVHTTSYMHTSGTRNFLEGMFNERMNECDNTTAAAF